MLPQPTSPQADNSERLLQVWRVETYVLHKLTSLLPDNSDRLLQVRLV